MFDRDKESAPSDWVEQAPEADLFGGLADWDREATKRWLSAHPLPYDFLWYGQSTNPRYRLKRPYGDWMQQSYRQLFERIHAVLIEHGQGVEMTVMTRLISDEPRWAHLDVPPGYLEKGVRHADVP